MLRAMLFLVTLSFLATAAAAQVTVSPRQSSPGAHEKYELRVPNERRSDMIAIEFRFPPGLRVSAVEQKPQWQAEAFRNASGGLIAVRWIGRLPPEQFTEFGLLAVNPPAKGRIAFAVIQAFADGTKVEWSDAAGPKTPPPVVDLKAR